MALLGPQKILIFGLFAPLEARRRRRLPRLWRGPLTGFFLGFVLGLAFSARAGFFTTFSVSANEVESGGEITFSWTSYSISGVNFMLSCADDVFVYYPSESLTHLSCAKPALTTDLGPNASAKFRFVTNRPATSLTITILPNIGGGNYDATQGRSLAINVKPLAPKTPKLALISKPAEQIQSGATTSVSWLGENIFGVNIILPCVYGLSTATSTSADALVLPCGTYALASTSPAQATTTLFFVNNNPTSANVIMKIIPALTSSSYDATRAQTLSLNILPKGAGVSISPAAAPTVTPAPTALTPLPTAIPSQTKLSYVFRNPLYYGLRLNADVKALQQILILEGVYSGPVTGNFFSLTKAGVIAFQKKYGIEQLGNVGPKTRAKLNSLYP